MLFKKFNPVFEKEIWFLIILIHIYNNTINFDFWKIFLY